MKEDGRRLTLCVGCVTLAATSLIVGGGPSATGQESQQDVMLGSRRRRRARYALFPATPVTRYHTIRPGSRRHSVPRSSSPVSTPNSPPRTSGSSLPDPATLDWPMGDILPTDPVPPETGER